MVPPERIELSPLAPEASTLSAELRGRYTLRIPRSRQRDKIPGRQTIGLVIDYIHQTRR
jgi:hypothetical protein